jgi:hypothetical protein
VLEAEGSQSLEQLVAVGGLLAQEEQEARADEVAWQDGLGFSHG